MASLDSIIATLLADPDHAIDAPEAWAQGRTLYGGMTAALSHAVALAAQADLPPLRSAQFAFVGPAQGQLIFAAETLRRGRSTAIVGVDARSGDTLVARSTFTFGAPRDSAVTHELVPAAIVPPPDDCPPLHRTTRPLPGFLARFDYRLAEGAGLFRPGARPGFAVWVRYREEEPTDPVTALLALTDALPCAAMSAFPAPAPVSTMTWTVDLRQPLAPARGWYLVRSTSEQAADGYSLQEMAVFDAVGTPLAASRQMVAIFA